MRELRIVLDVSDLSTLRALDHSFMLTEAGALSGRIGNIS